MTTYIALIRAVNVGGTGKLPMAELRALCATLGYGRVETYIASGNVVFDSELAAERVQAQLEHRLRAHTGKDVGVFLRTAAQMRSTLTKNPFADKDPQRTYAFFLHDALAAGALAGVRGRVDEDIGLAGREIYVHYPSGMGQSKLQIPAAKLGTARNLNTVAKLVELSGRRTNPPSK